MGHLRALLIVFCPPPAPSSSSGHPPITRPVGILYLSFPSATFFGKQFPFIMHVNKTILKIMIIIMKVKPRNTYL